MAKPCTLFCLLLEVEHTGVAAIHPVKELLHMHRVRLVNCYYHAWNSGLEAVMLDLSVFCDDNGNDRGNDSSIECHDGQFNNGLDKISLSQNGYKL